MNRASPDWLLQLPHLSDLRIGLLALALIAAALIDYRTFRIPNWLTVGGAAAGLALNAAGAWQSLSIHWAFDGFLAALAGMAAGLVILLPFYALRIMGAGDVKLMAMVGAFVGLSQIIPVVLSVFIAGGVCAVLFAFWTRHWAQLGSNLVTILRGTAFCAITGVRPAGLAPGASVGRLPYAVSIGLGTLVYLASRHFGFI